MANDTIDKSNGTTDRTNGVNDIVCQIIGQQNLLVYKHSFLVPISVIFLFSCIVVKLFGTAKNDAIGRPQNDIDKPMVPGGEPSTHAPNDLQ